MRVFNWLWPNLLCAALLYLGFFCEVGWAKNIITFMVPLLLVLVVIISVSETEKKRLKEKGPPVHLRVLAGYDIIFVLALVAAGSFVLATLYTIHSFVLLGVYIGDRNKGGS